jgi:ribonuclease E
MKRMLINATQQEELRMAMVDGQRLYDLNIEGPASERKKANIYKGKITRIEPSLEAAFVDYGADRHGFLPLKEISSEYFIRDVESGAKPNIREVLKEGQDIVVQIDKEERGSKGAALTTFVSLAGRFIVLKPNKGRSGGVSRRIVGSDRDLARESLSVIEVPDGMSVILRTAGIDRSPEELAWDLENLLAVWHAILSVVLQRPSPFLIYRESNAVVRALRDYLTGEIGEILIDDEATYKEAVEFVEQVMPQNLRKLKLYSDPVPLFTHNVTLPSGGSIVIDHTEALVSIDINSARSTKGGDIEATALNTNLEAADEIARQLRIRDLGGLIVIDFIDMGPQKNQRAVENRLREAVRQDRARVQIGKITRFGLLEMSRQRLRPSLGESSYHTCPRCSGFGTIRSVESLALAILRIVGEEARKERTVKVIAQLPVEVATYLLNEKRDWVRNLEARHDTQVVLIANPALETPHYDIRRVRDDQADLPENTGASYALAEAELEVELPPSIQERKVAEPAAIGKIEPTTPAPQRPEPVKPGFWDWLKGLFGGAEEDAGKNKAKAKKKEAAAGRRGRKSSEEEGRERGRAQRGRRSETRKDEAQRSKKKTKKKTKKKAAKKAADAETAKQPQDGKPAAQGAAEPGKDESREDGRRSSRSRRSRGGRRRRRAGDAPVQDAEQQPSSGSDRAQQARDPADADKRADAPARDVAADRQQAQEKPVAGKPEGASERRAEAKPADRAGSEPEKKSAETAESRPEKPAEKAESRPEKPAEKAESQPEKKSGNGTDGAKAAARPEGRLLPWEPAQLPAEIKKDKPVEPRPEADADKRAESSSGDSG